MSDRSSGSGSSTQPLAHTSSSSRSKIDEAIADDPMYSYSSVACSGGATLFVIVGSVCSWDCSSDGTSARAYSCAAMMPMSASSQSSRTAVTSWLFAISSRTLASSSPCGGGSWCCGGRWCGSGACIAGGCIPGGGTQPGGGVNPGAGTTPGGPCGGARWCPGPWTCWIIPPGP